MRRSVAAGSMMAWCVMVLGSCSGSSSSEIPQGGSTTSSSSSSSGASNSSSGASGGECPPCEAPPSPDCKGTGPCGCGPYVCPDASTGDCQVAATNACGPNQYCKSSDCVKGVCAPTPTTETQERAPACGCDGVTYWNESVAAKNGMSVVGKGACTSPNAKTCRAMGGTCPNGSRCNLRLPDKTGCPSLNPSGTCWQLPAECAKIAVGATTRACGSLTCTDECSLIKLMTPYYQDDSCPQ